ncbi:hypothetical protein BBG47_13575 [Paenibacillus sp. KS1]|uniref:vWA domain-containing protein n=1 Tax=Paenibacillus sp. KS1 TaxID=1849249 RepID=UPI0008066796|nr:VWA domain-containing protein [Paenibacillus sp. KS1]OBY79025.1 hypothetical protein BBG47_13575 [Paenibacillus sp. KS1]
MKQILLITDGCSNVGIQPAIAAAEARENGITVNVVGIVDYGTIGQLGACEIEEIASAGGGVSRIVQSHELSQTIQMMTRKTVVQTIQQAVNKELKLILGDAATDGVQALPLEKRSEVVRVMDDMTEQSALKVALLIDASASMKPKLAAVEEAIRDLMLSLQARSGKSELCVFHFPGPYGGEEAVQDLEWTDEITRAKKLFQRLNMRGTTPTGPALLQVIDYYLAAPRTVNKEPEVVPINHHERMEMDGVWSDYIV